MNDSFDWSKWTDETGGAVSAVFLAGDPWECPSCTFHNAPEICMCEMCGSFKPGMERRAPPKQPEQRQRFPYWEIEKLVTRPTASDSTQGLPTEVWTRILSYLPWKEQLNAGYACWELRNCAWYLFRECNLNVLKLQKEREEDSIRFILLFLVANCPNLVALTLPPYATNEHLALLEGFKRLEYLALAGWARVTDEGLLDLLPPKCNQLALSYSDPNLQALNMYKTKISNEGLVYLPQTLRVFKIQISYSEEGVMILESKFVSCQITT